jgi:hypothetical protein
MFRIALGALGGLFGGCPILGQFLRDKDVYLNEHEIYGHKRKKWRQLSTSVEKKPGLERGAREGVDGWYI